MKKPIVLPKGWKCPRCEEAYHIVDSYTQHTKNHLWHDKHLKVGMLTYVRAGGYLEVVTKKAIEKCYCATGQIADVLNKTDINRLIEIAPETVELCGATRERGMVIPSGNMLFLWSHKQKDSLKGHPLTKCDLKKFWELAPNFHIAVDAAGRLKQFPRNLYDVIGE
jgi:energy-converting hydrogenase Eha subunit C